MSGAHPWSCFRNQEVLHAGRRLPHTSNGSANGFLPPYDDQNSHIVHHKATSSQGVESAVTRALVHLSPGITPSDRSC